MQRKLKYGDEQQDGKGVYGKYISMALKKKDYI